jgi:hypothetical protein
MLQTVQIVMLMVGIFRDIEGELPSLVNCCFASVLRGSKPSTSPALPRPTKNGVIPPWNNAALNVVCAQDPQAGTAKAD